MCSKMDTKTTTGFFKPFYETIRKNIQNKEIETFSKLNDDISRIKFVNELNLLDTLPIGVTPSPKSIEQALEWKLKGNTAFQKKEENQALICYNKALLYIPVEKASDFAIIKANRSAVLQYLQQYHLALKDIDAALALDYPDNLKYKLYERKAKCHLALKENQQALIAFQRTLTTLGDAKLPMERSCKMQTDVQIMISMLGKGVPNQTSPKSAIPADPTKTRNEYLPNVTGAQNEHFKSASSLVRIDHTEHLGRYASADKDIMAGDTLLVEKAICVFLLPDLALTHCQHCFLKTKAPIFCEKCSDVIFCNELCKKYATVYHQNECGILKILRESGISVLCLMALRLITQKPLSYFEKLKTNIDQDDSKPKLWTHSDYRRMYTLVCHEKTRSNEDFLHRSHMSLFLLKCLDLNKYFETNQSTDMKIYIASLILKHLQLLQFNAHEISELKMDPKYPNRPDKAESIFLGGGLYTTLALFNHSCDPGIIRYFHGTSVIVRAAKCIKQGEIIAENYGPIFTETPIQTRKKTLRDQYWFECKCTPCVQDWPMFDQMNPSLLRFRCNADNYCPNVIPVQIDSDQFMAKCGLCYQHTNILKGLKSLQETDPLFKSATTCIEKGQTGQALALFIQILRILDETLAPPFKDYQLCQQGIRRCMLNYGNKSIGA